MDDRAASSVVGHALIIAIAMALVSLVLLAGTTYVQDQRDRAIRSQLNVVGQQVVGCLERADRLVSATRHDPETLEVGCQLPDRIVGETYVVHVDGTTVRLEATGGTSVAVPLGSTPVASTDLKGGRIVIEYSSGGLVMTDG